MEKRRTLSQYRRIDLILFAVMLAVFESIVIFAAVRWFPGEPYMVSLTPAITAVVMIRWGPWCGIHAVLGAVLLCVGAGEPAVQFVIYGIGNLFALLALWPVKWLGGGEDIRGSSVKALTFGAAVVLLMQAGRILVSLPFGIPIAVAARKYFFTDVITDLLTLVIIWIVRRLDGVLEDQVHYLRRIQKEMENNRSL